MSRIVTNFPGATGKYKVCINKHAGWQNHSSARLQISVGNPKYEGEKLYAALEWCNHRFDLTILIVSDTLQRHNHIAKEGLDSASAWKLSRLEGDRWLWRNHPSIKKFKKCHITRWDEWLNHRNYQNSREAIDKAFMQEPLKGAMDKIVAERMKRTTTPEMKECTWNFVSEEFAVFACQHEQRAINIYAGSTFSELQEGLKGHSGILAGFDTDEWLEIDMTRNAARSTLAETGENTRPVWKMAVGKEGF